MKRDEIREILFGTVAVLGFALVLLMSYAANRESARLQRSGYQIRATFNRVDGIAEGTDVQVSGISVGGVETIVLLPDYRVKVTMRINPDVSLPSDSSAAIQTDGLFGNKFVSIEPGGETEMLKHGSTITFTQDAVVVGQLLDLIISEGRAAEASSRGASR